MSLSRVLKWVLCIHVGVILFAVITFPSWKEPKPKRRITVRTVQLQEKKMTKPKAVPKKQAKPKIVKKQEPKKKEPPKEKPKKTKLIAAAKESLKKLRQKKEPTSSVTPITIEIPTLAEITPDSKESEYLAGLIEALEILVQLPEKQSVQLSLTLDKLGNVTILDPVESRSAINKTYVRKTLKGAKLPPYGTLFSGEKTHMFQIQLLPDA